MTEIILFSTETCPKCRTLKTLLDMLEIDYIEKDMSLPSSISDLRCMGYFGLAAPVLVIDGNCIGPESLFTNEIQQEQMLIHMTRRRVPE